MLLLRQYKHGVGRVSLTLPGGGLIEGETPLAAALWGYRFISEEFPSLQACGVSSSIPVSPKHLGRLKT